MELGDLAAPHNVQPRISSFTYDLMRASITKLSCPSCSDILHGAYLTKKGGLMESEVFVWPVELLAGIYSDLFVGRSYKGGFSFQEIINESNEPGTHMQVWFSFTTPLVETGKINLDVKGKMKLDTIEAMHSAVRAVLHALRTDYSLFMSDYSYIILCEKSLLVSRMTDASCTFIERYEELVHSAISVCCKKDALIVSQNMPICESICAQSRPPNRDMVADLQISFYALRAVFVAAMHKVNNAVADFQLVTLQDGGYHCRVDVQFPPRNFFGEPASSPLLLSTLRCI